MTGQDSVYRESLDRAYQAHVATGETRRAVRCAFWLGLAFLFAGESGRGSGWLANARQMLEREPVECAEIGYLMVPLVEKLLAAEDHAGALAAATEAVEIGERFADADLVSCARHLQGRALIGQGRVEEGLERLDQAMIAVTAGDLSPIMTGLIYCSVIQACQRVFAMARAWEWTSALTKWCEGQPQMVAFTSTCLVHRAEIMQLRGAWPDAMEESRRAHARQPQGAGQASHAAAHYQQAEVNRLRGDYEAAEAAYRSASQQGHDPQPGLALLRLSQERRDAAVAAMRRAVGAATDPLERARLLPAYLEILLAVDDLENARTACRELTETAARFDTAVLRAMATQAQGAVQLAEGDARAALGSLRQAFEGWQQAEAPYESARVRMLMGLACRACGDDEGAALELYAAKAVFDELGAAPDAARVEAFMHGAAHRDSHPLTRRELQVLRLVATGKTNKAIAEELCLSEKTVDRHASNIFNKLCVPSRAAATAYAYKHNLI
jgi:ATP/maltotriose-dependent transcriptional regulator MalT